MTTGSFTDWSGNLLDIGPLYPFVGWEVFMVLLGFIFWIGWHVLQIRAENSQLENEASQLRQAGSLQKAINSERVIDRL